MSVGKSVHRVDAVEKVTGRACYTDDFCDNNVLVAKVLHAAITNGIVKSINTTKAKSIPGVVKIVTCFDVPDIVYGTPGHPFSLDKEHKDVEDRKILNTRVRLYGDDIAAVVATDDVAAARALRAMKVEYEEYPPILSARQAMSEEASQLHNGSNRNIIAKQSYGEFDDTSEDGLFVFEETFHTPRVQHCHLENPTSYAYMEGDRIIVVSSTQIPHIMRRIIAQSLGLSWGKVRVIKPYVGGGFGNKQDVLYEPLNAYLCMLVGGKKVKLELTREETFAYTRSRHAIDFKLTTAVRKDGRLVSRYIEAISDQGAYASHGHSVTANAVNNYNQLYSQEGGFKADVYTVYTNLGTSGAMRAYGIPQMTFACESHMENIAHKMGFDPIEFRLKNMMTIDYKSQYPGLECHSIGLEECIEKGRQYIDWDQKRQEYLNQTGNIRRGVGCAIFCYKTGVYPFSLEISGARLVLNQDGSVQLQVSATEIGQGADTVFTQMAAETIGVNMDDVQIVSSQDTDITPFGLGAYASRQTYVAGKAIKQTAETFRQKILDYAQKMLDVDLNDMDIVQGEVVDKNTGERLITLAALATDAFYSRDNAEHIAAESTVNCKQNTFSFGACFAEVEVDMEIGKVRILDIINVHDSGKIINPALAEAQVHGGMSMGIGYGLTEQMKYNNKGQLVNGNFLDYKLPTSVDSPELEAAFVETDDPTGPYGNKSLGEPPAIAPAPAIRNAVFNATGIAFNDLPLDPEKLTMAFKDAGLI